MADVFSVVALLIMFREALEAAIIISIMLQMCDRLQLQHAKKIVWAGALSGCGIALIVGVIFIIIFYVAQNSVFSGNGKTVFEGALELIASFLITVLGFAMLKIQGYEAKWEHKLQRQAAAQAAAQTDTTVNTKAGMWGIFILAFSTTIREGLEAVVFIAGVSASLPISSIPLPAIVGIIMGLTVGVILYYTGKKITDIAWFIYIMTGLLFLIAAGLVGKAFMAFESIGWFGYFGFPESARPWQNQLLWDAKRCSIDINQSWICGILYAIFGYQAQGTAIWLFAYCGYWLELLVVVLTKSCSGTLLVAGAKRGQLKKGPTSAPGVSHVGDSARTEKGRDMARGKAVNPADFIVTPTQTGKDIDFKEEAEGSGSSGSDTHANLQHVQLADLHQT
ncbi:hypothetical protein ABBQ38_011200 [Trebouxia sp. C0009 RCD-2024]